MQVAAGGRGGPGSRPAAGPRQRTEGAGAGDRSEAAGAQADRAGPRGRSGSEGQRHGSGQPDPQDPQGFVQRYNAQAVVTEDQLIVAAAVTQEANDVGQLHPMLER